MKLQPRNNYVLIEILPLEEEKTKSGLVIPEIGLRLQQPVGVIRNVGPHVNDLKADQKVLITNGGFKHTHQGKSYVLLLEHEILATIE